MAAMNSIFCQSVEPGMYVEYQSKMFVAVEPGIFLPVELGSNGVIERIKKKLIKGLVKR